VTRPQPSRRDGAPRWWSPRSPPGRPSAMRPPLAGRRRKPLPQEVEERTWPLFAVRGRWPPAPRRPFSYSTPLWISIVASPPSVEDHVGASRKNRRPATSGPCSVAHQYSSRGPRPSTQRPGRPGGSSGVPLGPIATAGGGRGPGSRRCCTKAQRTWAPRATRGLDEHGGLDGHVQRARDPGAGPRG